MIIETQRLFLREITQSDFPLMCRHLQDAEVMYAYEHAFSDAEVQDGMEKQFQNYNQYGFGIWAVILKENGEFIGHCGLSMQPCDGREVLEIGYIFQKAYWHKGYATEAATACRDYAFDKLNADEVFSIIRDTNIASQNVAKRNGMSVRGSFIKHYYGIDMPHYIFSVKRDANEADFLQNLDKLHTTPMGAERIKRNLSLETDDIVEWCKEAILDAQNKTMVMYWREGKNWYIHTPDIGITVNAASLTIITAHKLKTKIYTMTEAHYPVLRELLYQAIFIPKGVKPPPREIINEPEIFVYIKDFGKQAGDFGVVAEHGGQIIGAAWTRIIQAYGHLSGDTPELAISMFPKYRGRGIGTKLMNKLFELLKENGFKQTLLSVQKDNPAVRFYKRLGYKITAERLDHAGHEDYLMVKELK